MALHLINAACAKSTAFALCGSSAADIKNVAVSNNDADWYCGHKVELNFWLSQAAFTEPQWTSCVLASPSTPATNAIDDLHSVVAIIQETLPLPNPSPEYEALLTRAVAARGKPVDIDAWAHQLSEDIGHLTD